MGLLPPAPRAGASANSATSASAGKYGLGRVYIRGLSRAPGKTIRLDISIGMIHQAAPSSIMMSEIPHSLHHCLHESHAYVCPDRYIVAPRRRSRSFSVRNFSISVVVGTTVVMHCS